MKKNLMKTVLTFLLLMFFFLSYGQASKNDSIDFDDVILFTNGESLNCIFIKQRGKLIYYYVLRNGKKTKTVARKKYVYSITENNISTNYSHKRSTQTGETYLMDLNSFSLGLYTGVTEFSYEQEYYTHNSSILQTKRVSYGNLLPVGITFAHKNYFSGKSNQFISGIRYGVTVEVAYRKEVTHTLGLKFGYTGLWKIKPKLGIELNFDTGFGITRWDFGPEFIGYGFDFVDEYILFSPSISLRIKDLGIGIGYSYYYLNKEFRAAKQTLRFHVNFNL